MSFEIIEKAEEVLRKAIVKKEDEKYLKLFHDSEIFIEIRLQKLKLYNKQKNHDLCLKEIEEIEGAIGIRFNNKNSHKCIP